MKYYLAYGSNLNVEQMQFRCPGAKVVGVGEIENYELMFKGSKSGNYLTIEPKEGSYVPVAVWKVTNAHEKALDRYEGYPNFYYKKEMPIEYVDKNGEQHTVDAFAYIMHEDRKRGKPTRYYVNTCLNGYVHFGFDIKLLRTAIAISANRRGSDDIRRMVR